LRLTGLFLLPFMPVTAQKIWAQLGIAEPLAEARLGEAGRWGAGGPRPMARGEPLFPRVELSLEEAAPAAAAPGEPAAEGNISLEEFRRLDLCVAEILEARRCREPRSWWSSRSAPIRAADIGRILLDTRLPS
jgi:hypothetical protein